MLIAKNFCSKIMYLVGILLALQVSSLAQNCEPILKYGVYDTTNSVNSRDEAKQLAQWFCNLDNKFSQQGKSSAWNAGGSYAGFGASAGSNSTESNISRQASSLCATLKRDEQFSQTQISYAHTINSAIVAAWSNCVTSEKGLVFSLESRSGGRRFALSAKYNSLPNSTDRQATLSDDLVVPRSIRCNGMMWKEGDKITEGGRVLACERVGNDGGIISLNTDRGAKTIEILDLPSEKPKPVQPEIVQSEWSYTTTGTISGKTSGRFVLTIKGNVITGTRIKETQDGKSIHPETHSIEGSVQDGVMKMHRQTSPAGVQFYELRRIDANTYRGRFYNEGANDDHGEMILIKIR